MAEDAVMWGRWYLWRGCSDACGRWYPVARDAVMPQGSDGLLAACTCSAEQVVHILLHSMPSHITSVAKN